MAVDKIVTRQAFVLKTAEGTDEEGNPIYGSQTFGNVRSVAQPADIYDVAVALNELQLYPLYEVELREYSYLEETA